MMILVISNCVKVIRSGTAICLRLRSEAGNGGAGCPETTRFERWFVGGRPQVEQRSRLLVVEVEDHCGSSPGP
jgi:hypothetical protein